jgi:hypothetical protein
MDRPRKRRHRRRVLMLARFLGFLGVFALAAPVACSGVAGISDFRVGSTDAGDDGAVDSSFDAAADAALPACTLPEVSLRIAVVSSASGHFQGITGGNLFTSLAVGTVFARCVPLSTQVELQAEPDESSASHDWGVCGAGRRCSMTIAAPTDIEVHLQ